MILLVVVLVVQFWVALWPTGKNGSTDVKNFFQNYLGVFVILIFYVGHKVWRRNWRWYIPLQEIDLDTGRKLADLDIIKQEILVEREYHQALPWYKKVYSAWC